MKRDTLKEKINSSALLRSAFLILMVTIVTPSIAKAQAKANFAGNWTMNQEKSTQAQNSGMRMGGGTFDVTQDANQLTVTRTRNSQNGQPTTMTMKYTLDGKESVNTNPRGEAKSVAKWSSDGKTLTIETTRTMDMNGETRTMKSTENWSLIDPKTLSITTTRQGPNGEAKSNMIYDKK